MLKIGLIGAGYWGPNLARVLNQNRRCIFAVCCDTNPRNLEKVTRQYPTVRGITNTPQMWESDVDAVVIATPIGTHFELVREALNAGKHVLVEKPLAHNAACADELAMMAERKNLTLMTGHTFIYSPPVIKVRELIDSGTLGDLFYISLSRVNLGLFQKDVDVVWDLAVHDVSILLYWLNELPAQAQAFGRACIQENKNDVAFLWLRFASGLIASIEISWLSPQKMRRSIIVGSKRMVVYDDTEPSEKIKIYDRGVVLHEPENFGEFQLTYRVGDMVAPNLSNVEPLVAEIEHFVHCVENHTIPRTNGIFGANVVRILEAAVQSSRNGISIRDNLKVPVGETA
jgi:predicted dehydrogenase